MTGAVVRYVTKARLRFDDEVARCDNGRDYAGPEPGQVVELGRPRTFKTLDIEITGANDGTLPSYGAQPGVGFVEVGIDGVRVDEVLRLPTDLLDAAGRAPQSTTSPSSSPETESTPPRRTAQTRSSRSHGGSRCPPVAPSPSTVRPASPASPPTPPSTRRWAARLLRPNATSSSRLPGDPRLRGASAIDGDPTTAWTTPLRTAVGQQLTVDAGAPITVDGLDLQVVADGEHSVPTELSIVADDGTPVRVTVPATVDGQRRGTLVTVPVKLPSPLRGRTFVVRIEAVRENTARLFQRCADAPPSVHRRARARRRSVHPARG